MPASPSVQRRPESELRRHARATPSPGGYPAPLNEGRSLNSGDTMSGSAARAVQPVAAQRRPESELRRHLLHPETYLENMGHAQRRPESELRRHASPPRISSARSIPLNEGRSLNSGDTVGRERAVTRLVGRSTKAGV